MHQEALDAVRQELNAAVDQKRREAAPGFFKCGPGGYGEGDKFLGVPVPAQRKIAARRQAELDLGDVRELLGSSLHEERFVALVVLVTWFRRAEGSQERARYASCYIESFAAVNNWDLVDTTAPYILGPYAEEREPGLLFEWARSGALWKERAAVLATLHFIWKRDFSLTLQLAEHFLHHEHDLMHKAVGWMLREVGNRNVDELHGFLKRRYRRMPRTMLRYAIEKLPSESRTAYLHGTV